MESSVFSPSFMTIKDDSFQRSFTVRRELLRPACKESPRTVKDLDPTSLLYGSSRMPGPLPWVPSRERASRTPCLFPRLMSKGEGNRPEGQHKLGPTYLEANSVGWHVTLDS